jgi:alpha-L-fucosidase 2
LTHFSVKSNLGGNCRLRTSEKLIASGGVELLPAKSENPNPFFATFEEPKSIISNQAKLNPPGVPASYLYDFQTTPGGEYRFRATE